MQQIDVTIILTGIGTVISVIGAMYGMLKFMLRDTHKEVAMLEKNYEEQRVEMRHVHNRLDGLYRVILDRTYGKNIPEDLK